MANHIKPTREELKANAEAALKELENIPPEGTQETPEEKAIREEAEKATAEEERLKAEEENKNNQETPEEKAAREEAEKKETDWKKRHDDSAREAQALAAKNKEINQAINEAALLTDISEDELKKEYPEWDEMTLTEQKLAKGEVLNRKKFELIHNATEKHRNVEEWHGKVDQFIEDPKTLIANPELEGKTEEFKLFAGKESRVGREFDEIVLAFLGNEAKKIKPNHQGEKMFESGTGGSKQVITPPDDKLTVEQGAALRKSNYPRFKELLRAGKIKTE